MKKDTRKSFEFVAALPHDLHAGDIIRIRITSPVPLNPLLFVSLETDVPAKCTGDIAFTIGFEKE